MNQFDFVINFKKVGAMTTKKDREAMVRKTLGDLGMSKWHSRYECTFSELLRMYKVAARATFGFDKELGLPDFLHDNLLTIQRIIGAELMKDPESYDKFVDTFQYTKEVHLNSTDIEGLKVLALIIKDNPLPFKFDYNFSTSDKYRYFQDNSQKYTIDATNIPNRRLYGTQTILPSILQVEEVKRALPSDIKYTVLEELLEYLYEGIGKQDVSKIDHLLQDAKNQLTTVETITAKLRSL